jgi:hypothetical protein
MTDLLKDTLTRQADSAVLPPLDLDTLVHAGGRRVHRRRITTALTGTLVTLGVIAAALTAVRSFGNDDPAPATTPPYTERRPTYASGNVIHYGSETIPTGARVGQLVQTDGGLVYSSTPSGAVTLLDGSGKHVLGKQSPYPRLITDGHSLVAWEEGADQALVAVVYDVSQHRAVLRLPIGEGSGKVNALAAVDRGAAYVWQAAKLDRIDLATGKRTTVSEGAVSLKDISADAVLYGRHDGNVSEVLSAGRLPIEADRPAVLASARADSPWTGVFSPTGKHVITWRSTDTGPLGRLSVHTPAGKELPIRLTGYPWQSFTGWLDDDRYALVAAQDKKAPADLLTCSIAAATCTVTAQNVAPSVFFPPGKGLVYLPR